jgi:phage terminase large subunit
MSEALEAPASLELDLIETFGIFLERYERTLVLDGGAGSGKSTSVAQFLCLKFIELDNTKFLTVRKTRPALKKTCYPLVKRILRSLNVDFEESKQDMVLTYGTNEWHFSPMDDPEKFKSFEAGYIWIEESTEIAFHDFLQLRMRLTRTGGTIPHIILTFNPISAAHWCITELVNKPKEISEDETGVAIHFSNYLDNPYLSEDFIKDLESLKELDPNWYRIYALGQAGVLANVVYSNYEIAEFEKFPPEFLDREPDSYGLDFGFTQPCCLQAIYFRENEVWTNELIYETGLRSSDLIARMEALNISHSVPIYCDSSRPEQIADLCTAGFNAEAANKSVFPGINAVKEYRLHISAESTNTIIEIAGYHFHSKPDGTVTETPLKFNDHAMDAIRYGVYSSRRSTDETVSEEDASHNYADVPLVHEKGKPKILSRSKRSKADDDRLYDDFR